MSISCNIIKDLLPLYHDKVCSEETKRAVEEHIKTCPSCWEEYDKMLASDGIVRSVYDEEHEKKIAESYKKVRRKNMIKTIMASCLALILVGVLALGVVGCVKIYKTWPVYPQPIKNFDTVEELKNGMEKDGFELLYPDLSLLHTKYDYDVGASLTDRSRYAKLIGYYGISGHSAEGEYFWNVYAQNGDAGQVGHNYEYKGIHIGFHEDSSVSAEPEYGAAGRCSIGYYFGYNGVIYTVNGMFDINSMGEEEIAIRKEALSDDLMNVVRQMIDSAED